jgi:phage terminase large subunit GpA-like protein
MKDAAAAYRAAYCEALRPPKRITVSEWADSNRILTRRSTPEPGPWRTDRVPHLREPMDLLSPHEKTIQRVILMFGAQGLAKTECGLNFLGTTISLYPAPFLIAFPSESFAKAQVLQRFKPLFEDTPCIKEKKESTNPRDAGNSLLLQLFAGGMFVRIIGGGSGSAMQGTPVRYAWIDEVSSFSTEVDGQGDPVANIEARQSNFGTRKKLLLTSTPGVVGRCRITKEFNTKSDQRRRFINCLACGAAHVMYWKDFKWDSPRSEVFWQCPSCGERIAEAYKDQFLASAKWVATAEGDGRTAGFHLPGWYAPFGWITWGEIRDEFLKAKNDRELLIGWVQKRAAEAFEEDTTVKFSSETLKARRFDTTAGNGYAEGFCPQGVVLVTIGVDVQGGGGASTDGLHAHAWGWGAGEERWHLQFVHIPGDPRTREVLDQLDILAGATWRRQDGAEIGVALGAIDEGGNSTEEVRRWCAERVGRWIPVKGAHGPSSQLLGPGKGVHFDRKDRAMHRPVDVLSYGVGYKASVDLWQNRLAIQEPGPGYVHLGAAVTDQVVEELFPWRYMAIQKNGLYDHTWILPSGAHDEAGDCARYAYAAMQLVQRRRFATNRDGMWDQLEAAALATIGEQNPSSILSALNFA